METTVEKKAAKHFKCTNTVNDRWSKIMRADEYVPSKDPRTGKPTYNIDFFLEGELIGTLHDEKVWQIEEVDMSKIKNCPHCGELIK